MKKLFIFTMVLAVTACDGTMPPASKDVVKNDQTPKKQVVTQPKEKFTISNEVHYLGNLKVEDLFGFVHGRKYIPGYGDMNGHDQEDDQELSAGSHSCDEGGSVKVESALVTVVKVTQKISYKDCKHVYAETYLSKEDVVLSVTGPREWSLAINNNDEEDVTSAEKAKVYYTGDVNFGADCDYSIHMTKNDLMVDGQCVFTDSTGAQFKMNNGMIKNEIAKGIADMLKAG